MVAPTRRVSVRGVLATLTLVVAGLAGAVSPSSASASPAVATGAGGSAAAGTYVPVTPCRLLDTRSVGGRTGTPPVAANTRVVVTAVSTCELPATGIGAVAVTLTAVNGTAAGYLTAYPADDADPGTSNLNWLRGQTVANAAVVPVTVDGRFAVRNGSAGTTHVVVDVTGYYRDGKPSTPGALASTTPTRVLDTRIGLGVHGTAPLPDTATIRVPVATRGQVAAGASSVLLNLTVTSPTTAGYATAGGPAQLPYGGSALNWNARQTVANLVLASVALDGTVSLQVRTGSGTAHLVADLVAFTTAGPLSQVGATSAQRPYRVVDTRVGASPRPVAGKGRLVVDPDQSPRPLADGDVSAVVVDVVVTSPTSAGYLTAYPTGTTPPTTSVLNWLAGQTVAAAVIVPVGPDGTFSLLNGGTGSTHVVVDLEGVVLGRQVVEAAGWSAEQVPDTDAGPGAAAGAVDVACAEGPTCAVLSQTVSGAGTRSTQVRRWDGATWGATAELTPWDPTTGAVACSDGGTCAAAVPLDRTSQVATSSGPGGEWVVTAPPVDAQGRTPVVRDVACAPGGSTCVAVGSAHAPDSFVSVPYAAVWSAGTWTATPVPSGGDPGGLLSVVCPTDTACTAVGGAGPGSTTSALAASWDGSAWTSEPLTVTGVSGSATATQVAARGSDVVVTGTTTGTGRFVGVRTGATWSATAVGPLGPPGPPGPDAFYGTSLACDAGSCFASASRGLASVPDVAALEVTAAVGAGGAPLASLSCSTSSCVGTAATTLPVLGARAVVLDDAGGSWTAAVAPSPADAVEGGPDPRVGATARVGCWAGGCLLVAPYAARSGGQPLTADVLLRSPCVTTCVAPGEVGRGSSSR